MLTLTIALALAQPTPSSEAPSVREQVDNYLAAEKWPVVFKTAEAWSRLPKADRGRLVELLTPSLTDCKRVPLGEVADLIIAYRVEKGDLKFQGHGLSVNQDLFTVGGRAAWVIGKLLVADDLPELNGGLTADEWANRADEIAGRVKDARKSQQAGVVGVRANAPPPEKK